MISIDGSQGEGGGQILRTSLALSLLTRQPFTVKNIRANRSRPGLQPQHLMSVRAATTVGQAQVKGASLNSTEVTFEPGEVLAGTYDFPINTAGATALVVHSLYLPLVFAKGPSDITVEGGTHVKAAPCFDFLQNTWLNYLQQLGLDIELKLRRPGFYPRGGGQIEAAIQPTDHIVGLNIEEVEFSKQATIISAVASLPENVAERQADRAVRGLKGMGVQADVHVESWPGGPGSYLGILLDTQPAPTLFFALGEKGKTAERVAEEALHQVEDYLEVQPLGVDIYSADQLVLPLSMAAKSSRYRVAELTPHLLTNVEVIKKFLKRDIQVEGTPGDAGFVKINI